MAALLIVLLATIAGCSAVAPPRPQDACAADAWSVECGPTGPTSIGRVTRVVDGDTIRAEIAGSEYRVRYIGMDTPESVAPGQPVEPFALAASEANVDLVDGQTVTLEKDVSEVDRFGRLLRYVWVGGPGSWQLVNLILIERGLATVSTYPPDVKYVDLYLDAQRGARDQGLGLWDD